MNGLNCVSIYFINECKHFYIVAALPLCQPADIEEGFLLEAPLIYHFGHTSPESNIKLYDMVVQKLADAINIKCDITDVCNISGAVINTCGWTQKEGYQCLLNTINAFEGMISTRNHMIVYLSSYICLFVCHSSFVTVLNLYSFL